MSLRLSLANAPAPAIARVAITVIRAKTRLTETDMARHNPAKFRYFAVNCKRHLHTIGGALGRGRKEPKAPPTDHMRERHGWDFKSG
jgi:hypothetical protein